MAASRLFLVVFLAWLALAPLAGDAASGVKSEPGYDELLVLFSEWRRFERPPLLEGAPDYTREQFDARQPGFMALRQRLDDIDVAGWPVPQQVDWHLVRAEMNGYDFNRRVLQPWARDPAFYNTVWMERSDVPAHEGPTHHAVVEVWTHDFPLDATSRWLLHSLRMLLT